MKISYKKIKLVLDNITDFVNKQYMTWGNFTPI